MNFKMSLGRLAWKEYRVQRDLWLSVLILTALVQFLSVVAATLMRDEIPLGVHAAIPFIALGVYMLGCGATLFAIEHETGTFDFQRLLPVNAWHVFIAKTLVGIISGALLFAALMTISHSLYIGWQNVLAPVYWCEGALIVAAVFDWAVFCSLLLRHVLRAAVCGIVCATATVSVFPMMIHLGGRHDLYFLGAQVLVVSLMMAFNFWLAHRWFHDRIGIPDWFPRRTRSAEIFIPIGSIPAYRGERSIGWHRMARVAWQQGRWLILLSTALYVWAFLITASSHGEFRSTRLGLFLFPITYCSVVLFGLCAFTLDQWSYQFRFYTERGVDPRWLWFSRHVVWFLPTMAQSLGAMWLSWSDQVRTPREIFLEPYAIPLIAVTIYSTSQFCAMFIRSTLVAFVASVFAALLSGMWTALTVSADIPIWWSVLPIPIVLLFTTWKFSADWIEERKSRRHYIRLAFLLGIPAVSVLVGCTLFRAYQIPLIDPGFSIDDYTRPLTATEQETLDLYQRAEKFVVQSSQQTRESTTDRSRADEERRTAWLKSMQPAVDLLAQAHERPAVPVTLVKDVSLDDSSAEISFLGNYNAGTFLLLLRLHAESLTQQEKLSEAWRDYEIALELLRRFRLRATSSLLECADVEEQILLQSIVRWSAHPLQTKDRIAVALAKLEGNESQETFGQRWAKMDRVLWEAFLQGQKVDPATLNLRPQAEQSLRWILTFMPWERTRFRRLLNIQTRAVLDPVNYIKSFSDWTIHVNRWRDTTVLYNKFGVQSSRVRDSTTTMSVWRRAARIMVAICDWRREHGQLPSTLQLLSGPYFREVPMDSVLGWRILYSANGLTEDVISQTSENDASMILPKNTPFLCLAIEPNQVDFDIAKAIRQGVVWHIPESGSVSPRREP